MTGSEGRQRMALLAVSALLLTLAQPPFPLGWLAYAAFVPYLAALEGLKGRRAFLLGVFWGLLVNLLGLFWIAWVNVGALAAALVYLALLDGLLTWALVSVPSGRRPLLLPFLWTAFLFVKSLGEMGFPWLTLGLTQSRTPAVLQMAPLAGAWLIEVWICGINALLYTGIRRGLKVSDDIFGRWRSWIRPLLPAAGLALLGLLYGHLVLAGADRPGGAGERRARLLRVAAIQGSVRPTVKLARSTLDYNLWLYERLSLGALAASGDSIDLLVWPETAVPEWLEGSIRVRSRVRGIQSRLGVPVVTGAFSAVRDAQGTFHSYNAAFLADAEGLSAGEAVYRKRILVPFGERVPYQALFGFLKGLQMGWSDFSLGEGVPLMRSSQGRMTGEAVGVLICYESLFARMVRSEVLAGASVLAVITNDAWFGRTSGPYQHLWAASLRAAEFRRPVIRAANSGVSGFVDRWGRLSGATPLFQKAAAVGEVRPEDTLTPYARYGDWLPLVCAGAALLLLLTGQRPGLRPASGRES